ncbi:DUF4190 domain-containing protein [Fimbriiglobus ruber]|uniref:DUF4190 domain-containing protein n=1 Tax=Fimbriiglobus ruber TaxID=1908690 RepID=UPI000B4B58F0|nr:DUF4190 domain-containing protein [Fimbriiglobus ruber]
MPLPEDAFYKLAAKEITSNRLAAGIWGRAFCEMEGETAKAQALYIKLRVEQLSRLISEISKEGYLRQVWPDIQRGDAFVCPYCNHLTKPKTAEINIFVRLLTDSPEKLRDRYYCSVCNKEQVIDQSQIGDADTTVAPAQSISTNSSVEKSNNPVAIVGFLLGLLSVFLYAIGIIPILAIVFSGIGLATFNSETQKNKWVAGLGLALGVVYTIMMLNQYGHIK